ncbi:hypothetical protein EHQ12_01310 [Leptospira gomenensis]|uniref:Uncharacterized protein n=1 Tax=Leptospira gomenensis TaxID=2484974 RepID=A0A5F1YZJ4_9LEPT|nr:hypothetical protein [Leptospira gomenensis]TGK34454.1 hypothetical protein EHQ17_08475 [Leptospira gomenensis]TGK41840.1 hypothetical protein EHQ07_15445 [Leptospira gomenensis]TGK44777.1 hypothetical protein EHQ12_01310 [Leptospira gomenensis]TGK65164.1 hypothetical protein EHQ13_05825 [Leptospira gomenensis]
MSLNRLQIGFLLILLLLFVSRETHTHSERELAEKTVFEIESSDPDSKPNASCPICELQRSSHTIANPDLSEISISPVLGRYATYFLDSLSLISFFSGSVCFGRAPPFLSA